MMNNSAKTTININISLWYFVKIEKSKNGQENSSFIKSFFHEFYFI